MALREIYSEDDLLKRKPTVGVEKMIGKTYRMLSVLAYAGYKILPCGMQYHYVLCRCVCGKDVLSGANHLRYNNLQSCGCIKIGNPPRKKHGFATINKKRKQVYTAWVSMRERCFNKKNKKYPDYGGRGISVCKGWQGKNGFVNFLEIMGEPVGESLSLDRKENDNGYTCGSCKHCIKMNLPLNCRWADKTTQANNRRTNRHIVYCGKEMTFAQCERFLGLKSGMISNRIGRGWTMPETLATRLGAPKNIIHTSFI